MRTKYRPHHDVRANVRLCDALRIASVGSWPGINAFSRNRISNPPPAGGATPVCTVTELPLTAVTVSAFRFAK